MVGAASVEVDSVEAAFAAVEGAVEAAYRLSRSRGDRVRHSVVISILKPRRVVSPELERRLAEVAERLSEELPTGRAAWRGASLVKAVRLLINAGGIDLAASLAYFMILSLLPLVALVIMGVSVISEPEGIRVNLTEVLVYYFPTSQDLIEEAVDNLLNGSLTINLIALVSIVIGANGLFMAPNRSVSRVFGIETKRITQITLAKVSIATLVVTLFLFSVGLTAFLQAIVSFEEGISETTGLASSLGLLTLGIVASEVVPALVTAVVFAFVQRRIPSVHVEWRDATFGAIVAIVFFEVGKHPFFWFTGLAGQRSVVYGPIASVVVLMMWGFVGGLIFLYGAALSRAAGELRPTKFPVYRQ